YRMTPLSDESMADAQAAIRLMLDAVHPCGAVAFDGAWNIVMANRTYVAWVAPVLPRPVEPLQCVCAQRINLLELLLSPSGFRTFVLNGERVVAGVPSRVKRDLVNGYPPELKEAVNRLGTRWPEAASPARIDKAAAPILPVELETGGKPLRLFNTFAT